MMVTFKHMFPMSLPRLHKPLLPAMSHSLSMMMVKPLIFMLVVMVPTLTNITTVLLTVLNVPPAALNAQVPAVSNTAGSLLV